MSKIYRSNFKEGLTDYDFTLTEPDKPTEELPKGSEFVLRRADVKIRRNDSEKTISNKFFTKADKKLLHYRFFEDPITVTDQNKKRIYEEVKKIAESCVSKFNALKQININQPIGGHRFNIPTTFRLVENEAGEANILVTDVTNHDKKQIHDLKDCRKLKFDEATIALIRKQIQGDMHLAELHQIALSNSIFPLDSWSLVTNKETNERRVMILDIGQYIILNAGQDRAKKGWQNVNHELRMLKNI